MSTTGRSHEQLQPILFCFVGETIAECGLSKTGDRVMVCLSGGKGSYALLDLLLVLQRRAPIHFDLVRSTWIRSSPVPCPTLMNLIILPNGNAISGL